MVTTPFERILKEFEGYFNCTLTVDENQCCLIKMGIGISLQLELNHDGSLLVGSVLGTLPMSRYRENIIRAALKVNGASIPSEGVFAFSSRTNHLILFLLIDPNKINRELIHSIFPPFINKAKMWKEAIDKGETPEVVEPNQPSTGLFGLMR